MANKKGCWKWAIVGGVSAAVVFAIAMVLGFSLQKHTILPGRSTHHAVCLAPSIPHSLPPEGFVPSTALMASTLLPVVVQLLSRVQLFVTPWTEAHQAFLSFAITMSIESVMPSNPLILCCPLLFLPSTFPSIRIFCSQSALLTRWPKYWSFSFSISPSNEYSRLVSFRIDLSSIHSSTCPSHHRPHRDLISNKQSR